MVHLVLFAFRGLLLLWTVNKPTDALEVKGHLPDISSIHKFLDTYVRPYIKANTERYVETPIFRADANDNDTTVEETIDNKITKLKPLLQDYDEKDEIKNEKNETTDDNLTLEGNDETTIIEFLPKIGRTNTDVRNNSKPDPFRAHIKKYKKMRNKIRKMLIQEKVSNKTRNTVIKTLDEIMARMIENRCAWNSAEAPKKLSRAHQLNTSVPGMRRSSDTQLSRLRRQYKILQKNLMNDGSILDIFENFFADVNTDTMAKQYKIQCQLVEVEEKKPVKPRYKSHVHKNNCENFKLCSEELKEFLIDFYTHLNDTVVSVFKNYAAMYLRDVNMDADSEKDTVISIINNIGDVAERKVEKLFKVHTNKIELDKNKDKNANIIHVNDYIKLTIEDIKNNIKKRVEKDLNTLRARLYLSVKEDLDVNLDVDLSNLERLFIDRICTQFVTCNGKYSSSRKSGQNVKLDGNNVYVKVRLTIDDELMQDLRKVNMRFGNSKPNNIFAKEFRRAALQEKFNNITVTRTTIFNEDVKTTALPKETSVDPNLKKIDTKLNEV